MNPKDYMKILRPKQWVKNFFVMLPLFFGGELFNTQALLSAVITMLAYSFAASSIYCFNDIHDVSDDRRHPVKCHRPVASGAVSIAMAYGMMIVCFILSAVCVALLPDTALQTGGVILFYWLLNLAYCAWLKQHAIIDVCIVAFGFVLRLLAGGLATHIELSKWIVLMTFLITLFMSFAKRRDDVIRMEKTGEAPRKNTIRYNLTFINHSQCHLGVLYHVYSEPRGHQSFQNRLSLSDFYLCTCWTLTLYSAYGCRPTEW